MANRSSGPKDDDETWSKIKRRISDGHLWAAERGARGVVAIVGAEDSRSDRVRSGRKVGVSGPEGSIGIGEGIAEVEIDEASIGIIAAPRLMDQQPKRCGGTCQVSEEKSFEVDRARKSAGQLRKIRERDHKNYTRRPVVRTRRSYLSVRSADSSEGLVGKPLLEEIEGNLEGAKKEMSNRAQRSTSLSNTLLTSGVSKGTMCPLS